MRTFIILLASIIALNAQTLEEYKTKYHASAVLLKKGDVEKGLKQYFSTREDAYCSRNAEIISLAQEYEQRYPQAFYQKAKDNLEAIGEVQDSVDNYLEQCLEYIWIANQIAHAELEQSWKESIYTSILETVARVRKDGNEATSKKLFDFLKYLKTEHIATTYAKYFRETALLIRLFKVASRKTEKQHIYWVYLDTLVYPEYDLTRIALVRGTEDTLVFENNEYSYAITEDQTTLQYTKFPWSTRRIEPLAQQQLSEVEVVIIVKLFESYYLAEKLYDTSHLDLIEETANRWAKSLNYIQNNIKP